MARTKVNSLFNICTGIDTKNHRGMPELTEPAARRRMYLYEARAMYEALGEAIVALARAEAEWKKEQGHEG